MKKNKDILSKHIKAAIFDFDGVIIDSEGISADVAEKLLWENFRIKLSKKDKKNKYGTYDPDFYDTIFRKHGVKANLKDIMKEHNRIYDKLIFEIKQTLPGARTAIQKIRKKRLKMAICSSSDKYQIMRVLKNLGLKNYFHIIVSSEDTKKHKPDPAPYIITAKKLGIPPKNCIVFEDSEKGVKAAKKAGMGCIGVEIGNHGTQNLGRAGKILSSLKEI